MELVRGGGEVISGRRLSQLAADARQPEPQENPLQNAFGARRHAASLSAALVIDIENSGGRELRVLHGVFEGFAEGDDVEPVIARAGDDVALAGIVIFVAVAGCAGKAAEGDGKQPARSRQFAAERKAERKGFEAAFETRARAAFNVRPLYEAEIADPSSGLCRSGAARKDIAAEPGIVHDQEIFERRDFEPNIAVKERLLRRELPMRRPAALEQQQGSGSNEHDTAEAAGDPGEDFSGSTETFASLCSIHICKCFSHKNH